MYKAITRNIGKWWTKLSNEALQPGDRLVVRFEEGTCWVMTVSDAIENRSLVWQVIEAFAGQVRAPRRLNINKSFRICTRNHL